MPIPAVATAIWHLAKALTLLSCIGRHAHTTALFIFRGVQYYKRKTTAKENELWVTKSYSSAQVTA